MNRKVLRVPSIFIAIMMLAVVMFSGCGTQGSIEQPEATTTAGTEVTSPNTTEAAQTSDELEWKSDTSPFCYRHNKNVHFRRRKLSRYDIIFAW